MERVPGNADCYDERGFIFNTPAKIKLNADKDINLR